MKYTTPIASAEHAEFCKREAERRYGGRIVRDEAGMLVVKQADNGLTHTDAVLRALSDREPPRLSRAQCRRIDEAIMDAKMGDFDWEDVCRVAAKELPNADGQTIAAIVNSRWDR